MEKPGPKQSPSQLAAIHFTIIALLGLAKAGICGPSFGSALADAWCASLLGVLGAYAGSIALQEAQPGKMRSSESAPCPHLHSFCCVLSP